MNVRVSFNITTDNYGCKSLNQIKTRKKNQLSINVGVSFLTKISDNYECKSIILYTHRQLWL